MARREINLGTPNGKDGDIVRDAFNKTNQNFLELYTISGGAIEDLTELAQDYAAQMFIDGDHVGISVTYQDDSVPPKLNLLGFNGAYAALTGKPTIPAAQVNSDWSATSGVSAILNKPALSLVATSNNYADLTGKPDLSQYLLTANAFSGNYNNLTNKPVLFSGSYTDLTNKPVLFSGSYNNLTDKPVLFSGSYTDLTNKPTIPAAQVNSDWSATSGVSAILNKPTFAAVATSGQYNDLLSKPTSLAVVTNSYDSLVINGLTGSDPSTYGGDVVIKPGTGGSNGDLWGSVVLQSGANKLQFNRTGSLIFPNLTETSGSEVFLQEEADFIIHTKTRIAPDNVRNWTMTFDKGGVIRIPSNGTIVSGTGVWALDSGNKELSFPNSFRIQYGEGYELLAEDVRLQSTGAIKVQSGTVEWVFATNGVLTLPSVGDIRDNAGRSLLGGGVSAQVTVASGSRDLDITDVGKHIYIGGEEYIWVPHNSEVNFPIGSTITVVSKEAPITVQNSSSQQSTFVVLYLSGNPGAGAGGHSAIFIPAYSTATLLKVAANIWMVSGTGLSV